MRIPHFQSMFIQLYMHTDARNDLQNEVARIGFLGVRHGERTEDAEFFKVGSFRTTLGWMLPAAMIVSLIKVKYKVVWG